MLPPQQDEEISVQAQVFHPSFPDDSRREPDPRHSLNFVLFGWFRTWFNSMWQAITLGWNVVNILVVSLSFWNLVTTFEYQEAMLSAFVQSGEWRAYKSVTKVGCNEAWSFKSLQSTWFSTGKCCLSTTIPRMVGIRQKYYCSLKVLHGYALH